MHFLLSFLFTCACTAALAMEPTQPSPALPGSAWQVTNFAGQTPLADHPITFAFDAEGNIAGNASCNRFGGTCKIDGDKIEVGRLRSTRRACEPDVMQQEHKFLALLGAARTWEITAEGTLVVRSPGGESQAAKAVADAGN